MGLKTENKSAAGYLGAGFSAMYDKSYTKFKLQESIGLHNCRRLAQKGNVGFDLLSENPKRVTLFKTRRQRIP